MTMVYEEFIRCPHCGSPEFLKKELLTFHKRVARQDEQMELQKMSSRYIYVCADCGEKLNK